MEEQVLTVSQLTGQLKSLIEGNYDDVWVSGEIVGLRPASSGHVYLSLKDDGARLGAVIFRSQLRFLAMERHEMKDGAQVLCHGRLDLYPPQGAYKLIIDQIRSEGRGTLLQRLEELKSRLQAEGLFDADRKRPLPFLPSVVGIVTSPTSAAIEDMLRTLQARFPIHIKLYPALVQGDEAARDIVQGIRVLGADPEVDVVIVGRGGGAFEDLLPFSDEQVVRAVAACPKPIVSAVGHEIDFPLCDFAADRRAATPTAAAQLVVPDKKELTATLQHWQELLHRGFSRLLDEAEYRHGDIADRLASRCDRQLAEYGFAIQRLGAALQASHPVTQIRANAERLENTGRALAQSRDAYLSRITERLAHVGTLLEQLGPVAQLTRGYSVVRRKTDGSVVTDSGQAPVGDCLEVILHKGRLGVTVDGAS